MADYYTSSDGSFRQLYRQWLDTQLPTTRLSLGDTKVTSILHGASPHVLDPSSMVAEDIKVAVKQYADGLKPGAGAKDTMGTQLQVRQQSETIMAWRAAGLKVEGNKLRLSSLNYNVNRLELEGVAQCGAQDASMWSYAPRSTAPKGHAAPHPDCTCGFYACDEKEQCHKGAVMLRVELSGKVIKHEKGYRAERQRIMALSPATCEAFLCDRPSTYMMYDAFDSVDYPIWTCDEHSSYRRSEQALMSVHELASHLGIEVMA